MPTRKDIFTGYLYIIISVFLATSVLVVSCSILIPHAGKIQGEDIYKILPKLKEGVGVLVESFQIFPSSTWLSVAALVVALMIALSIIPGKLMVEAELDYMENLRYLSVTISLISLIAVASSLSLLGFQVWSGYYHNEENFVQLLFSMIISSFVFIFGALNTAPSSVRVLQEMESIDKKISRLAIPPWCEKNDYQGKVLKIKSKGVSGVYSGIFRVRFMLAKYYLPSLILLLVLSVVVSVFGWQDGKMVVLFVFTFVFPLGFIVFIFERWNRIRFVGSVASEKNVLELSLMVVVAILLSLSPIMITSGVIYGALVVGGGVSGWLVSLLFLFSIIYTIISPLIWIRRIFREYKDGIEELVRERLHRSLSSRRSDLEKILESVN
ncbi:hypothetical protein [Rothia nasisuis]|uniref:hypothetical protein n=1 Tax=Rothia nasisuis TaxID=2109647 RepID=UPI001F1695FF|nr:hypothetical protein [Rothia nasisuis]